MEFENALGDSKGETPENANALPFPRASMATAYSGTVAAAIGALLLSGCVVISRHDNAYDDPYLRRHVPLDDRTYVTRPHRIVVWERPAVVERPPTVVKRRVVVVPKSDKDGDGHHHRRERSKHEKRH